MDKAPRMFKKKEASAVLKIDPNELEAMLDSDAVKARMVRGTAVFD